MPEQGGMNVNPYDTLVMRPWREAIGLDEGQWANLTNLVALHMVLDRMLTLRLLTALCTLGTVPQGGVEKLAAIVAEMAFGRRLALATECGILSEESAADLSEVNRARNTALHFKPRLKEGFKGIAEIDSTESLNALFRRATRVFRVLTKELLPLFEAAAED